MSVVVRELKYVDPFHVVLALENEPHMCFLDSSKTLPELGRYSYVAVDPFMMLNSKGEKVFHDGESIVANPFDYVDKYLKLYQAETIINLPPFQGGAMGYFAYDLLHHLEKIPKPRFDPINMPDMTIGLYDVVVAFDHKFKKAWIISQGFPEVVPALRHQRAKRRAEQMAEKIKTKHNRALKLDWRSHHQDEVASNFSKDEYCQAIEKTIDYVYAGDIYQANITQCFTASLPSDVRPFELYAKLRLQNPAPFSAFLNFDDVCVASASPERFIKLTSRRVETRPIKGTRPRSACETEDKQFASELLNSEKDFAENVMIVDLMRNDLSRVCLPDSVHVRKLCELQSFETVHHLVSTVEAELIPNKHAIDLLKAAFPGGSITGAPKVRAMEIIREIETMARGVYCGCIGYIGFNGNMDTSIVIRTYTIKDKKVYFQAGGGIVADSIPNDEYDESLAKVAALEKALKGNEVIDDFVH